MELRQLKYFVRLAETLNFSEAARQLCVTQSTLSQQIRQLEQETGTPLLQRNSHSVSLTEAGADLLPQARRTLFEAQTCLDRIADLNNLSSGTLSIGVTYSFSPMLTETLLDFSKAYPGIRLNVVYQPMEKLMEMLSHREVDFVLAFRPLRPIPDVDSHVLFQNRLAAIVNEFHPLASLPAVTLDELMRFDLALPSRGLQARSQFDSVAAAYEHHIRLRLEVNSINILLRVIRESNMATVLAEGAIYNVSGVKAVPLDVPGNEMAGCVHVLRNTYHKRSMKQFIAMLSDSLAVRERRNSWL